MAFRGANQVYVSISFYDILDKDAINNGIEIGTGLYLSDNAICYNDIAAEVYNSWGFFYYLWNAIYWKYVAYWNIGNRSHDIINAKEK